MKKFFLSIIITITLGVLVGKTLCSVVHAKSSKTLYLVEVGSYVNYNDAIGDTANIINKIIVKNNYSYDVYIAVSFNKNNLRKITNMYKKYSYTYYIREEEIYDEKFIKNMSNFDLILMGSKKVNDIQKINNIMLSYYDEKFVK